MGLQQETLSQVQKQSDQMTGHAFSSPQPLCLRELLRQHGSTEIRERDVDSVNGAFIKGIQEALCVCVCW